MYTQAQVNRMLAQARRDAQNAIPSATKQAAMKKKMAEEKMDAKMKAAVKRRSRSAK
jgi:hypothetical protein